MASVVSKIGARLRSLNQRRAAGDGAFARAVGVYRRRHSANRALAADVASLRAELALVRERHGEQIERLEELSAELARAVETLRASIARAGRDR